MSSLRPAAILARCVSNLRATKHARAARVDLEQDVSASGSDSAAAESSTVAVDEDGDAASGTVCANSAVHVCSRDGQAR